MFALIFKENAYFPIVFIFGVAWPSKVVNDKPLLPSNTPSSIDVTVLGMTIACKLTLIDNQYRQLVTF